MVLHLVVSDVRIGDSGWCQGDFLMRRHLIWTSCGIVLDKETTMEHVVIASRLSFRSQIQEESGWKVPNADANSTHMRKQE